MDLSQSLAEIQVLLGSGFEDREYNIFGVPTIKIDYEEGSTNQVRGLINEINKILDIAE